MFNLTLSVRSENGRLCPIADAITASSSESSVCVAGRAPRALSSTGIRLAEVPHADIKTAE